MICKNCIHSEVCKHKTEAVYECEHFKDGTIKNQYDRIRNMSVEEMAELFSKSPCYCCKQHKDQTCKMPCRQGVKQWLESEVDTE